MDTLGKKQLSQLAAKLKALKEESGASLEEIAEFMGLNRSTVKRWLDGSTVKIKRKYIHDLERFFRVSPGYLFDSEEEYINLNDSYFGFNEIGHRFYGYVEGQISAGSPSYIEDDRQYSESERNQDEDGLFWLQIKGESMNKIYRNGTYVLVKKQFYAEYGDCVAARINENEATVKFFKQDGDIIYLYPFSTDPSFEVQVYDLTKDSVAVMGVVLEGRIEGIKKYF